MPFILGTNSIKDTGYNVDNSLRFNSGSDDTLTRTVSSASNRRTFTYSGWIKKTILGTGIGLFGQGDYSSSTGSDHFNIRFEGDDNIRIEPSGFDVKTNRLFRDPSAWYHIVLAVDTTQGTASNRVKLYVNGVQETSLATATYPDENEDTQVNTAGDTGTVYLGDVFNGTGKFNGYMAEVCFIDGQALAPTSFGEFDEDSPTIWKPIDVSGLTFGNNGFYLETKQAGTSQNSSGLGADTSGNDNHFAVNNLTAVDQSTDTCTNNFATMNLLDNFYGQGTFSEGNLQIAQSDASYASLTSTIGVSSGKWYAEIKWTAQTTGNFPALSWIGIVGSVATATSMGVGNNADSYSYIGDGSDGGKKRNNGSSSSYGDDYDVGDIIGIALDLDNNKIYWSKNGTFQNSGDPTSGSTGTGSAFDLTTPSSGFYYFAVSDQHDGESSTWQFNFGSPPFAISSSNADGNGFGNFEYAVPSGYFALCSKNLAEHG